VPIVISPAVTVTATVPPLPLPPRFEAEITALLTTERLPASTVTPPPLPAPEVEAEMPAATPSMLTEPVPSIDSAPVTVTVIGPEAPELRVTVEIAARFGDIFPRTTGRRRWQRSRPSMAPRSISHRTT
jgi:hypothetical protein